MRIVQQPFFAEDFHYAALFHQRASGDARRILVVDVRAECGNYTDAIFDPKKVPGLFFLELFGSCK
jgi:hypothetical protein